MPKTENKTYMRIERCAELSVDLPTQKSTCFFPCLLFLQVTDNLVLYLPAHKERI